MKNSTVIYNARLLDANIDFKGAIFIQDKKIVKILKGNFDSLAKITKKIKSICSKNENLEKIDFFDAKKLTVMPAFIDMHVHLRDPGLTQKEDIESGLKAAENGGFGCVVAMPNTKPVISSQAQAVENIKKAESVSKCKLIQSVSITKDFSGNDISHLNELDSKIVPLITEDGYDVFESNVMYNAMKIAGQKGIVVSCHCEDSSFLETIKNSRKQIIQILEKYNLSLTQIHNDFSILNNEDKQKLKELSALTNKTYILAEDIATIRNIEIAKKAGCHIHLCHVSTKGSLDYVRQAKNELKYFNSKNKDKNSIYKNLPVFEKGFNITCEVTPHHIALEDSDYADVRTFVNPPVRKTEHRKAVIKAIKDGTVDVISTDHAPHTMQDKLSGSPGFTGLEASYAICHTVLVCQEGISEQKLSDLMSEKPAQILNLNKGLLKTGFDADLILVDPNEKWQIDSNDFKSKGKVTPFNGKKVIGRVKGTF